jgi:YHS domain-containing protein
MRTDLILTGKKLIRNAIYSGGLLFLFFLNACSSSKGAAATTGPVVDLVCNMKITDLSEAYKWKYKDKTYYFDSQTCKETFKMNPMKFINNTCTPIK